MNKGKIHQIIGPVIDIKFNEDEMPELLNAVNIEFQGRTIVTEVAQHKGCLLYTSPSPRDTSVSRMPSSA